MQNREAFRERAARLRALLETGAEAEELAAFFVPASRLWLLRRLALLRRFDREAFAQVAGRAEDGPDERLEALLAAREVVESARQPGIFTLSSSERQAHLDWWGVHLDPSSGTWAGPEEKVKELLGVHRRMADHFGRRGEEWRLETLFHLCVCDPARAVQMLAQQVAECLPQPDPDGDGAVPSNRPEARDGIALARALDTLRVAEEQRSFLPGPEKEAYVRQHCLLEAWSQWSHAWHCSRRYVPRREVHGWFDELRRGDRTRLLVLHAPGGSGKTMSLRWLLTHHCIPRGDPIAHLDFDHFVGGAPLADWQLLLRCAEQLNLQLAGRPLDSLIERISEHEKDLLVAQRSQPGTASAPVPAAGSRSSLDELPDWFGQHLHTSLGSKTVTVIIDTLEEAMVRSLTNVTAFVTALIRFAIAAPNVRLILCGRYPLSHLGFEDQLRNGPEEVWRFHDEHAQRRRLPQFDLAETATYLRSRGVPLDDAQVARLFEKCSDPIPDDPDGRRECSPFDLSLIATLHARSDEKDRQGELERLIEEAPRARVVYLMERVISRVTEVSLRWIIRYGVVPRRLTRAFLEEVILRQLEEVHNGRSSFDNPGEDDVPEHLLERSFFFQKDALLEASPAALWSRLSEFASSDSWIEQPAPDMLVFQARVRQPMRDLLRERAVLRRIHQSATEYFEGLAAQASSGARALEATREALYHAFQWEAETAAPRLQQHLEDLLRDERFEGALLLARDASGDDFPELPAAARREVLETLALAALDLADTGPAADRKARLGEAFFAVAQLRSGPRAKADPAGHAPVLAAMVTVRQSTATDELLRARDVLRDARAGRSELRSRIDRSIAIAGEALGDRECVALYAALLDERLASGAAPSSPLSVFLTRILAVTVKSFGGGPECWALLAGAKRLLIDAGDDFAEAAHTELVLAFANLMEGCRRPDGARHFLEQSARPGVKAPELDLLKITGVARTHPEQGVGEYREFINGLKRQAPVNLRAAAILGEAWTQVARCDPGASDELMHEVLRLLRRDAPALAARCHLIRAEHQLYHFGDLAKALRSLRDFQRTASPGDDPRRSDALRARGLELELAVRTDDDAVSSDGWSSLLADGAQAQRWPDMIRVALTFIRLRDLRGANAREAEEAGALLAAGYERIPDSLGRAHFSWLLRGVRAPLSLSDSLRHRLVALLEIHENGSGPLGEPTQRLDFAWAAVAHATVLRLLGEDARARELAAVAESAFRDTGSLVGLREVFFLTALAGWEAVRPEDFGAADLAPAPGALREVIALEQAELALEAGDPPLARSWMESVSLSRLAELRADWGPRAQAVAATLALDEGRSEEAHELIEGATTGFTELGNSRAARRLINLVAQSAPPPEVGTSRSNPAVEWPVFPHFTISDSDPRGQAVLAPLLEELGTPGHFEQSRDPTKQGRIPIVTRNPRYHQRPLGVAAPFQVVRWLAEDPSRFAGPLFDRMADGLLSEVGAGPPRDLRWELAAYDLAALPWELARFNDNAWNDLNARFTYRAVAGREARLRWLQVALRREVDPGLVVDGIWGARTAGAFATFRDRHGSGAGDESVESLGRALREAHLAESADRPVRAAILQSTFARQERTQRGLEFTGSELPKLYESVGIECRVLQGIDLDQLSYEWPYETPPELVHIYAPYFESESAGILGPDFGGEVMKAGPARKGGSRRWRFGPSLVILDGPGEPDPLEHVRQLLLRNATAESLAQRGDIANVLAIGLDEYPDFGRFGTLLHNIGRHASFREILRDFVMSAPAVPTAAELTTELLHRHTGSLAPALWTADPDLSAIL